MLRPLFLHKSGYFGVSVGALPSEDDISPVTQKKKKKKKKLHKEIFVQATETKSKQHVEHLIPA